MEDGTELTIRHGDKSNNLEADVIDINVGEEIVPIATNNDATGQAPSPNPANNGEKPMPAEKSSQEKIPEISAPPTISDPNKKDYPLPTPKISEMTPPTPPQPSPDSTQLEKKEGDPETLDLFKDSEEDIIDKEHTPKKTNNAKTLSTIKKLEGIDEGIPEIEEIDAEIIDDDEIENEPDMPID